MLGIKVKGENHFELKPIIGGDIEFAKGSYQSIYGEIKSSWQKKGNKVIYNFEVPSNCTADAYIGCKLFKLEPGKHEITEQN